MAEYMVILVWDQAATDAEGDLGSLPGAWEAVSRGQYVTGVPVTAESPLLAYERALTAAPPFAAGVLPTGFAVEPVTERPHFKLAKPVG